MKADRKASLGSNKRSKDLEAPIQRSTKAIGLSIFLLLFLAGLGYLLFSTLATGEHINRQRLIVSGIALLLLVLGLLVFIRGLYKKPARKKMKSRSKKYKATKK